MIVELIINPSDGSSVIPVVSAVAAVASAIAAIFGLGAIAWQIGQARKTFDLQTLQTFLKETKDYERSLSQTSDNGIEEAFVEFLNFLEVYAAAVDGKLVPRVSKSVISLKLRDSLAAIQNEPASHNLLIKAISSPETFEYLLKFLKKNKKDFSKTVAALQKSKGN